MMVCPDWFPFSAGLAQSAYETCKQMEKAGHEVRIIVAADKNVDNKGMNVFPIKYASRLLGMNPIVFNYYQKIKEHTNWCDVICLFSYMFEMNSRIVVYKKMGLIKKPIVHFYRGSLESDYLDRMPLTTKIAKTIYDRTCGALLFKYVDAVVSNSEPTLELMKKRYNTKTKLFYVSNALDTKEYNCTSERKKRVIFIGRFVPNKGIKLFPEIMKALPEDWNFTVIGGGPMKDLVESYKKHHKNYTIVNKIPHYILKDVLAESSILVLPSYAEGAPRAVMEAAACGVPSISFNVGDVSNMIPTGTGHSCPQYNLSFFVEKLKELISDQDKLAQYSLNTRIWAEHKFDWEVVYPEIEEILKEVVKKY